MFPRTGSCQERGTKLLPRKLEKVDEIPRVSLADMAFLVLIFCLVCTAFAVEEGLGLQLPSNNTIGITGFPDGRIEIDGRPVSLDMVRPTVEAALIGNDRLVVVIETDTQSEHGLLVDILDRLESAKASRISLKEHGR